LEEENKKLLVIKSASSSKDDWISDITNELSAAKKDHVEKMDKALEKIRRLEEENQHLNQTCVKARKRVEDLELENKKVHQDAESMRRSKDGKINALRNEFMTVENDKNDVINELTRRLTKAKEDNNDKLADALKKITVLKEDNAIIPELQQETNKLQKKHSAVLNKQKS